MVEAEFRFGTLDDANRRCRALLMSLIGMRNMYTSTARPNGMSTST